MFFWKFCIGGAIGGGITVGKVNMRGMSCNPKAYRGWFVEGGATIGPIGIGIDVGLGDRGPGNGIPGGIHPSTSPGGPSGTVEGGGGVGAGAPVKITLCRYYGSSQKKCHIDIDLRW